jgi:hypothetical protein
MAAHQQPIQRKQRTTNTTTRAKTNKRALCKSHKPSLMGSRVQCRANLLFVCAHGLVDTRNMGDFTVFIYDCVFLDSILPDNQKQN